MAWETRGNHIYFYLSQRSDGRVRKRYFGNGLQAEVEAMRLERKQTQRAVLVREKQLTASVDVLLSQHVQSTRDLVDASLLVAGFHNPKSRGWRRRRMIASNTAAESQEPARETQPQPTFPELVQAARQGDRSVIPALRKMLWAHPELTKNNGDLASVTQIRWIDLIAGHDLYFRECLLLKLADFKRKLRAETNGSVIEELLVDQAASTWLEVNFHQNREAVDPADCIRVGEYRLKKSESAFRRHMKALSALTSVKTLLPVKVAEEPAACLAAASEAPQPDRGTAENRIEALFERSFSCSGLHPSERITPKASSR